LNQVQLIGRLTRDAEQTYTKSGAALAKFSLAVNERRKQGDEWVDYAHFIDCTLWGKRAESLAKYLTKGSQIGVVGSLDQQRWEKDGVKRSKVEVKVFDVTLLGSKSDESGPFLGSKNDEAAPF